MEPLTSFCVGIVVGVVLNGAILLGVPEMVRAVRRKRRMEHFSGGRIRLDPEGLRLSAVADRDAFKAAVVKLAGGAPLDLHHRAALCRLVVELPDVTQLSTANSREGNALAGLVMAKAKAAAE